MYNQCEHAKFDVSNRRKRTVHPGSHASTCSAPVSRGCPGGRTSESGRRTTAVAARTEGGGGGGRGGVARAPGDLIVFSFLTEIYVPKTGSKRFGKVASIFR